MTIIVLLILSGVSINAIVGDNGILKKTIEARNLSSVATLQEEIENYRISHLLNNDSIYDIYPIEKSGASLISMKTKVQSGDLSLSDLSNGIKNYLVKKRVSIDTNIIEDINNIDAYDKYYYVDAKLIPSAKKYDNKLVLYIFDEENFELISFDGLDWGGD